MDRYFTVMVIPEREKGVRSFRIPRLVFHALLFIFVVFVVLLGILTFDYIKILNQVYENRHLTIDNRQLKEKIKLFHMKINALTEDIERIHTFEKKLRIITGIKEHDLSQEIAPPDEDEINSETDNTIPIKKIDVKKSPKSTGYFQTEIIEELDKLKNFSADPEYLNLKNLYEQKIATTFGLQTGYKYTKEWSELIKQSFEMATQFAQFDYKFSTTKNFVERLEVNVHKLDQFLLDKDSFLKSTPTLLPTRGWITSYYGPRISPTSKRLRMHEGLDIGARPGTPIVAPADARVAYAGVKPGFGKFVQLDHGYGIESFYAHAKSLFVKKGAIVNRGDLIAKIGNTGSSTGPHLHYEIRVNGTPVDPLYYVLNK